MIKSVFLNYNKNPKYIQNNISFMLEFNYVHLIEFEIQNQIGKWI